MSHYRVAVFANDPSEFDELLAPYGENNKNYYEFVPLEESSIEWLKQFHAEHCPETPFEEFLTSEGYINSEVDGSLGFMANPNAKWDWYTLGGGDWQFDFLPGETYDDFGEARKNQYNYRVPGYNEDRARKDYARRMKIVETGEDPFGTISKEGAEYFLEEYPDVECYLLDRKWIHPYAFITPDGKWHAPGKVGWFAVSDDTPETRKQYMEEWVAYIQSDENPYVNFVDCHI